MMPQLLVFNNVSLDGYFKDDNNDMSWAHNQDPEWNAFTSENASGNGQLLFGRVTYEMMLSFWPTPRAQEAMPTVAERMNKASKFVFSRTLDHATWNNTQLVKGDLVEAVRKLKALPGADMVLMGSGSVVSQLAQAGLVDSYQIVIHPIVLGKGKTLFENVQDKFRLQLVKTRAFGNGNVVLWYTPASDGF